MPAGARSGLELLRNQAYRKRMKSRILAIGPRLKMFGISLLLFAPPAAVVAADQSAEANAAWQQAAALYIDGATKELDAYSRQVSAAADAQNRQEWRTAKAKLDECEILVQDLKPANPTRFDRVKAEYERARGELAKALQAVQKKQ